MSEQEYPQPQEGQQPLGWSPFHGMAEEWAEFKKEWAEARKIIRAARAALESFARDEGK